MIRMLLLPTQHPIHSQYYYYYFTSQSRHYRRIKSINIPLPSVLEQQIVIDKLQEMRSKLDALKRHQAETAAELDVLLPAILERAFRGEL
jgi:restriction endonuclease S subunit